MLEYNFSWVTVGLSFIVGGLVGWMIRSENVKVDDYERQINKLEDQEKRKP